MAASTEQTEQIRTIVLRRSEKSSCPPNEKMKRASRFVSAFCAPFPREHVLASTRGHFNRDDLEGLVPTDLIQLQDKASSEVGSMTTVARERRRAPTKPREVAVECPPARSPEPRQSAGPSIAAVGGPAVAARSRGRCLPTDMRARWRQGCGRGSGPTAHRRP
jgi:hypothetical protein